jgi:hypothetical protein
MTRVTTIVLPAALALVAGCGDNTSPSNHDMTAVPDQTVPPDMTFVVPPTPQIGAQIDRMGRAAINAALVDPFDIVMGMTKDQLKDAYNKDSDETKWAQDWVPDFLKMLAIYDGADTVCGNQVAADMTKMDPSRYQPLAGVLADDRLYLDTTHTTCNSYLAVEEAALGLANTDCGGRTPLEDVIDETYTALTVGVAGFNLDGTFAITDGVPKDLDGVVSLTTFPFLADPN